MLRGACGKPESPRRAPATRTLPVGNLYISRRKEKQSLHLYATATAYDATNAEHCCILLLTPPANANPPPPSLSMAEDQRHSSTKPLFAHFCHTTTTTPHAACSLDPKPQRPPSNTDTKAPTSNAQPRAWPSRPNRPPRSRFKARAYSSYFGLPVDHRGLSGGLSGHRRSPPPPPLYISIYLYISYTYICRYIYICMCIYIY